MTGKHHIYLRGRTEDDSGVLRDVTFNFTVVRNITVIRGNSGTGKSTLVRLLDEMHGENPRNDIINRSDIEMVHIPDVDGWEDLLNSRKYTNKLLIFDEDCLFTASHAFARYASSSTNYFIIINRNKLACLPYSYKEIYEFVNIAEDESLHRVYNTLKPWHENHIAFGELTSVSRVIVEDSNAGYTFFKHLNAPCESAKGRDKIYELAKRYLDEEGLLIIGDGAAFGPAINDLYTLALKHFNIHLFLPESFEWLILKSDVISDKDLQSAIPDAKREIYANALITDHTDLKDVINSPADYIKSECSFSWERFFTMLLTQITRDKVSAYNKKDAISEYYLSDDNILAILAEMHVEALQHTPKKQTNDIVKFTTVGVVVQVEYTDGTICSYLTNSENEASAIASDLHAGKRVDFSKYTKYE